MLSSPECNRCLPSGRGLLVSGCLSRFANSICPARTIVNRFRSSGCRLVRRRIFSRFAGDMAFASSTKMTTFFPWSDRLEKKAVEGLEKVLFFLDLALLSRQLADDLFEELDE